MNCDAVCREPLAPPGLIKNNTKLQNNICTYFCTKKKKTRNLVSSLTLCFKKDGLCYKIILCKFYGII